LPSTKNCRAAPSVAFDLSKVGIEEMVGDELFVDTRVNGLQIQMKTVGANPGKYTLVKGRYSLFAVVVKR
jgi:hypothetical protein